MVLVNPLGLHARAAAKLVDVTKAFAADIEIAFNGNQVDAKSIMALLMLGAPVESKLIVSCNGPDEAQAIAAVAELIAAGFYEIDPA